MDDDQQFCLRWNNHQSTLISVFDTLLENGTLVDCTLAAEGKFLKAHKVVLSACSPYFAALLSQQYDKHPIFILKDVKFQELRAMMDYMYRGEVNISQDQLAALLKAAESLQIKGLSDSRGGGNGTTNNTNSTNMPSSSIKKKVANVSINKVPEPPIDVPIVTAADNIEKKTKLSHPRIDDIELPEDVQIHFSDSYKSEDGDGKKFSYEMSEENSMEDGDDDEPGKQYECRHCGKRYRWKSTLRRHESVECGGKEASHECPYCNYKAKQRGNLGVHIRKHHQDKPPLETRRKSTKPLHTPPEDLSITKIAGLTWDQWNARLAMPLVTTLREDAFTCPDCGRMYKLKSSLRNHQKWECGKEPQFQCPYCVYRAKQKMHIENIIYQDNVDKPWICKSCGRQYKWKNSLKCHIKNECGVPPKYHCSRKCGYKTHIHSNLKRHLNSKFSYSCSRCGNSYARPHSLNRHIRFECGVEPKFEYKVRHSLIRHLRHECFNDQHFICPECSKKFSHGFIVIRHLQQVHKMPSHEAHQRYAKVNCLMVELDVDEDMPVPKIMMMTDGLRYVCGRCGVKYKKISALRSHLRECGRGAQCPLCPKIVTQKRNLAKHMEKHKREGVLTTQFNYMKNEIQI
ncbi:unnamed protein product [Diamesa serratosioi]